MCVNWLWTRQRHVKGEIKTNKYKKLSKGSSKVSSLFTSLPLYFKIDVILGRIDREKEIITNTTLNELKELLLLCTKNVHFSFNGQFYLQKDMYSNGVPIKAYGWIGKKFIIKLSSCMTSWKRYVDGTIAYVKADAIDHVLSILNSFQENIWFTYEQEINGKISFLDILILRNGNSFETAVHRKSSHNDMFFIGDHLHQIYENEAHLEH